MTEIKFEGLIETDPELGELDANNKNADEEVPKTLSVKFPQISCRWIVFYTILLLVTIPATIGLVVFLVENQVASQSPYGKDLAKVHRQLDQLSREVKNLRERENTDEELSRVIRDSEHQVFLMTANMRNKYEELSARFEELTAQLGVPVEARQLPLRLSVDASDEVAKESSKAFAKLEEEIAKHERQKEEKRAAKRRKMKHAFAEAFPGMFQKV